MHRWLLLLVAACAEPPKSAAPVAVDVQPVASSSVPVLLPPPDTSRPVEPAASADSTGPWQPSGDSSNLPFDRRAAAKAIGHANAQQCASPNGYSIAGSGPPIPVHVTVTFDPSGVVSSAVVDNPPYAGTSLGACIAQSFLGLKVPPFAGSPVRIGKALPPP